MIDGFELISQTTGTTDGAEVIVECARCRVVTRHLIVTGVRTDHSLTAEESDTMRLPSVRNDFEVIQCQGCRNLSFRSAFVIDPDDPLSQPAVTLYPERSDKSSRHPRFDVARLTPAGIRMLYVDSVRAMNSALPVLAGIGLRAVLDGVCNSKRIAGRNLYSRINTLAERQILTPVDASALHRVRFLGNKAAHQLKPPTSDELTIALRIIEHLLEGVYALPRVAKGLRKERPKTKKARP